MRLVPKTFGPELFVSVLIAFDEFFIEPAPGILPRRRVKRADDLPKIARDKLADLRFPLDHDGQRGRLHPAHGGFVKTARLRVKGRHGAGAVDANQPVGFGTAESRVGQRPHGVILAQLLKALANRRRGHGLQPEALNGLLRLGKLDDVAENQFALAPGVTSIDERVHVVAFNQLLQDLQPRLAFLNRQQVKMRRNHRQTFECPFAARGFDAFGWNDGEQMADGRRDDIFVTLVEIFDFLETAERLGNVAGHRRFFCNDKCLAHLLRGETRGEYLLCQPPRDWHRRKMGQTLSLA